MAQPAQTGSQTATGKQPASSISRDVEFRVDLCPPATVTLITDAEREHPSHLVDISQSTLRLLAEESLPLNELVCVELAEHLILADVRKCETRGSKFITDAARLVTLPKTSVRDSSTKSSKIEALVADFHGQCQLQLSTLQASIAFLEAGGAIEQDAQVAQKPPAPVTESLETARPQRDNVLQNKYVTVLTSSNTSPSPRLSKVDAVVASPKGPERFVPKPNPDSNPDFDQKSDSNGKNSVQGQQSSPQTFTEHMTFLGTAPPPRKARRWTAPLVLVAAAGILAGAAWMYIPWRPAVSSMADLLVSKSTGSAHHVPPPAPKANFEEVAQAANSSENVPAADVDATSVKPISTKPSAEASSRPAVADRLARQQSTTAAQFAAPRVPEATADTPLLHASLKANAASWVAVCFDGKERFQHLLTAGKTEEIAFADSAVVRLGYGPAVDVTFEGKPVESSIPPGTVRAVEFNADGARFVNYRGGSKACGTQTNADTPSESASIAH